MLKNFKQSCSSSLTLKFSVGQGNIQICVASMFPHGELGSSCSYWHGHVHYSHCLLSWFLLNVQEMGLKIPLIIWCFSYQVNITRSIFFAVQSKETSCKTLMTLIIIRLYHFSKFQKLLIKLIRKKEIKVDFFLRRKRGNTGNRQLCVILNKTTNLIQERKK